MPHIIDVWQEGGLDPGEMASNRRNGLMNWTCPFSGYSLSTLEWLDWDGASPRQICRNPVCRKILVDEVDIPIGLSGRPLNFGWWHLCADCFALFDGQKMRGRFRGIGMTHDDMIRMMAGFEQIDGKGPDCHIGHPSEEDRYTESMEEWLRWQQE